MRNFIVVAVVVLSAILGANQALAFERGGFAESANAVTPLLNGQFAPKTTLKMADGTPVSLCFFIAGDGVPIAAANWRS